jgi:hypothetical protein
MIKNCGVELSFKPQGLYTLKVGAFELKNCTAEIEIDGVDRSPQNWTVAQADGAIIKLTAENEFGKWLLEFNLTNKTEASVRLSGVVAGDYREINLYPMRVPRLTASHVLAQGPRMGGCSSILAGAGKNVDFTGHYQLMITDNRQHLQLSFPLKQRSPALFTGNVKDNDILGLDAVSNILHYGKRELETEALTLRASEDGFKLMTDYADASIECEKDFTEAQEPGWNSWDYYRWTITEEEVLNNARFIANDPVLSKYVKRIIVDDGWQYCYGEWDANPLFPNGMKYLAEELTKLGFEPGIWVAPTIIEPHSRIAQWDYDMLAKGESGEPCLAYSCMGRYGFVLDPTVEKSRTFLYDLFSRYADMGYKYFKLDFIWQTLKARKFADPNVPRSEIQAMIMEPIFAACHGKAAILGCNYLFESGNKYVDAVRTGSDIHATWHCIKNNTASVAARFWSDKRLWVNDPDFALCRGFDTSNDPDITRLLPSLVSVTPEAEDAGLCTTPLVDVNRKELEILLSIVIAAGGARNLSDKMSLLNESGLDLARRTVSAEHGPAAIPLDLFESELPIVWLQDVNGKYRILLINWKDEPENHIFDLNEHGINASTAVNFWNDEVISLNDGRIEAALEPRSCLFAVVE